MQTCTRHVHGLSQRHAGAVSCMQTTVLSQPKPVAVAFTVTPLRTHTVCAAFESSEGLCDHKLTKASQQMLSEVGQKPCKLQEAAKALTLEWPAMPLNLKMPIPHTSIGSWQVGKGLLMAELGVHTSLFGTAHTNTRLVLLLIASLVRVGDSPNSDR